MGQVFDEKSETTSTFVPLTACGFPQYSVPEVRHRKDSRQRPNVAGPFLYELEPFSEINLMLYRLN